jgi:hypothetical protein
MRKEGVNPDAVISIVRVYSGNLEDAPTLTHFFFPHWWVVFRDSDGNWWSAERVGPPLLQRVDSRHDGKFWRKNLSRTTCQQRQGGGVGITTMMKTFGSSRRTMKDLVEWLDGESSIEYDPVVKNSQDFGDDLCKFLTGIGVLHISTKSTIVGALTCIPLAPLWKIGNFLRGAFN